MKNVKKKKRITNYIVFPSIYRCTKLPHNDRLIFTSTKSALLLDPERVTKYI